MDFSVTIVFFQKELRNIDKKMARLTAISFALPRGAAIMANSELRVNIPVKVNWIKIQLLDYFI